MNIFASDPDPAVSAQNLDDKRVVKMCLETAQMLSTAARVIFGEHTAKLAPLLKDAYVKHPCTLWASAHTDNFYWLAKHGKALSDLYTLVYGKMHKNAPLLSYYVPADNAICRPPVSFPNCTRNESAGVDFKHIPDTHLAYRMYLKARWVNDKRPPTWQRRQIPTFFLEAL